MLLPHTVRVLQAEGASTTMVEVQPYATSALVGDTFTINITVLDVQNLYGLQVTLYWSPSVLSLINSNVRLGVQNNSDGALYNPLDIIQNVTNQQEGEYLLAAVSIPPAHSFNGSGNVVRLTFNVTGAHDSPLNLQTELYDYPPPDRWPRTSEPIPHTDLSGFYDVTPPTITTVLIEPSENVMPGQQVGISCNVTDTSSGVKNVTLFYSVNDSQTWETLDMTYNSSTSLYGCIIPGQSANTTVDLKIVAYDFAGNEQIKDGDDPSLMYTVVPEMPPELMLLWTAIILLFVLIIKARKERLQNSDANQQTSFINGQCSLANSVVK